MRASRLATLVVLAPALAAAQGAGTIGDPPASEPQSSQTYTVQRGDTLWDLSAKFLDSPWYWPKLWSYNPQIANPHWIYPGNVLRFYPASGGAPARIEVVSEDEAEQPRELEDLSRAELNKLAPGDGDDVAVAGPYRIGYVGPKGVNMRHDSFVTQREVEESGTLTAAFEEKLLLTVNDRAYAKFTDPTKVQPGSTHLLYRTERPVRHPVSGEIFGFKSTIIGVAKVVAVDSRAVTVEIEEAYEPIERGALIGPWTQAVVKQVKLRANGRELSGFIIAAQQDLVSEIGEHHVVFVDKGRADGVEEGNVFTVTRSGDPYGREMNTIMRDEKLPKEVVGMLLVVDTQQTTSAALVMNSLRELYVGDRVEMRPPSIGTGR